MDPKEIIEIFDDEEDDEPTQAPNGYPDIDRRELLTPIITRVVDALGGYEGNEYKLGDESYGCLKDLKRLWRKDDTDDDRTVARIFYETRVLPNDLIPILLTTAGQGLVEDKRAIACADLMTAMTWPIDVAEELKELDDEIDEKADYTQLIESHLTYKAALLKTGVMKALFGIILPPLAKKRSERQERDGQIINVVLHLIRNLAFIKDLPPDSTSSADNVEMSSLQSKLIRILEETHILRLLLTIAANHDEDPLFNSWNTLVLEIFYLLFRGIKPVDLAADQAKRSAVNLKQLLAVEERNRREVARKASSRHSRFGTTITVSLKKPPAADNETVTRPIVLHRQQAIHGEAGSILDIRKKGKAKKGNTIDELTREDNLSIEARVTLKQLATDFLEGCFNPFLAGLLKDIRAERAKVTEKDNLRLLYVTKWFLEFFLAMRAKAHGQGNPDQWSFGLIAEVVERVWIVWVLKRMRESMEEKPKLWTELQAGIECLTQLFLLIDAMSSADIQDPTLSEAAELLLQQLIYNGEVLDISLNSLQFYKEGTQSLTYLDSSVHLAYSLLRMLERWTKKSGDGTYVRKKMAKRKKRRPRGRSPETEEAGMAAGEADDDEGDDEDVVHEVLFSFEAFEMKFANADITNTLLTYLARYKEFSSPEKMKRVVSLMHRQAVKAKAEGLFFKAFFPKNRGNWKQYSSWEPEKKKAREGGVGGRNAAGKNASTEVEVKKGYSLTDQIGIAIAALVDSDRRDLVVWTQDILRMAVNKRKRIIDETDDKSDNEDEDIVENDAADAAKDKSKRYENPSEEARQKIQDEVIPYVTEDRAEAASKNAYLKLLFRLVKFMTRERDEDDEEGELEWYIPASLTPVHLERFRTIINQFLETPFDPSGKKLSELLRKKRRSRRRRTPSPSPSGSDIDEDGERRKKKRQRKEKEKQVYKSAQFIEDSDEEYGDMEAFLAREKALREKMGLIAERAEAEAAANGGGSTGVQGQRPVGMRATGTKKRRKRKTKDSDTERDANSRGDVEMDKEPSDKDDEVEEVSQPKPKPRPRPRPRKSQPTPSASGDSPRASSPSIPPRDASPVPSTARQGASPSPSLSKKSQDGDDENDEEDGPVVKRRAKRLFLSDSEDDE
ncbi:topoisomerase 1-associated factor 1 [Coprinopsis cinerea okayama7|uniref:Topoisomerase 1-associated factor 1 n=1 Tax=Coprinopsis cinerea (strain Okayama-7 / 130 / ATCC MYA-4618 / FGSC 9003) TaxID=240176 RepID=A8P182_COPC7|nr:topoisomerase 1-associated factor 1 [Coprinopsis cinerea okayama7\|eukprot:XP_001838044.2 topoisomerase 1-associated factor 1 [Coprinopsis cinerea okayama7\